MPRRRRPPRAGALTELPPLKIAAQIAVLQCLYYAGAFLMLVFATLVAGHRFGMDLVFGWDVVRGDTTQGWIVAFIWLLNGGLFMAVAIVALIARSKLVPDFALTVHALHLLFTSLYSHALPRHLMWYVTMGASAAASIALGMWGCRYRELQPVFFGGGRILGAVGNHAAAPSGTQEEEGDIEEQQGKALNVSTTLLLNQVGRKNVVLKDEDLGINVLIKKKGVYDFDTRGKKGREKAFPMPIRRKRIDDFGEIVRAEDFLRADEKEDDTAAGTGALAGTSAMDIDGGNDGLGKKRRWDDVAKTSGPPGKRQQVRRAGAAGNDDGDGAPGMANHGDAGYVPDELDLVEDDGTGQGAGQAGAALGPCKLVYRSSTVAVNLRLGFVDFSGIHDKRSLNMLIPLIQPRKLILIGGNSEETAALAEDCRAVLRGADDKPIDIFTPTTGTWVDASVDTNAWVVKLADPLVRKLKWQTVKGLGIVTISGQLLPPPPQAAQGEGGDEKRQKTETSSSTALVSQSTSLASQQQQPGDALPLLSLPPAHLTRASGAVAPVHVGDLRLADLRRALLGLNHAAEFRGEGTLVVDGVVSVRKLAEGRVEVESVGLPVGRRQGGTLGQVRRVIYDNLAVVAGA